MDNKVTTAVLHTHIFIKSVGQLGTTIDVDDPDMKRRECSMSINDKFLTLSIRPKNGGPLHNILVPHANVSHVVIG